MRHWEHSEILQVCTPGKRFIRLLGEEFLHWLCIWRWLSKRAQKFANVIKCKRLLRENMGQKALKTVDKDFMLLKISNKHLLR